MEPTLANNGTKMNTVYNGSFKKCACWVHLTQQSRYQYYTLVGIALLEAAAEVATRLKRVNMVVKYRTGDRADLWHISVCVYIYIYILLRCVNYQLYMFKLGLCCLFFMIWINHYYRYYTTIVYIYIYHYLVIYTHRYLTLYIVAQTPMRGGPCYLATRIRCSRHIILRDQNSL